MLLVKGVWLIEYLDWLAKAYQGLPRLTEVVHVPALIEISW